MPQDAENGQQEQEVRRFSKECGLQIKAYRKALKLTRPRRQLRAGIAVNTLSAYERGEVDIPTERLCQLAVALRVRPGQLYGPVEMRELALQAWLEVDRPEMMKQLYGMADRLDIISR